MFTNLYTLLKIYPDVKPFVGYISICSKVSTKVSFSATITKRMLALTDFSCKREGSE